MVAFKISQIHHNPKCMTLKRPLKPGARSSKTPETSRARKTILSSDVSKNGEVYTPESYTEDICSY